MKVYRHLSEKELNLMLEGKTQALGNYFSKPTKEMKYRKNTHNYDESTKYIHFFKHKNSLKMMSYINKNLKGNFYFCTFDIPFRELIFHGGKGFYPSPGYDTDGTLKEYAVPVDRFKTEWLIEYTLDEDRKAMTLAQAFDYIK